MFCKNPLPQYRISISPSLSTRSMEKWYGPLIFSYDGFRKKKQNHAFPQVPVPLFHFIHIKRLSILIQKFSFKYIRHRTCPYPVTVGLFHSLISAVKPVIDLLYFVTAISSGRCRFRSSKISSAEKCSSRWKLATCPIA